MRQKTPLSNVKILPSRMRKDLGDLDGLAESISQRGLIQPIVLTSDFVLVAGERRYRAHERLGLAEIDFVFVSDQFTKEITESEQEELEFEENFWRKNFTWQEEALGMLSIYNKKKREGRLKGHSEKWQLVISQMFGMSIGNVNYILQVAKELQREIRDELPMEERKFHKFVNASDAYKNGILAREEERLNKELARSQVEVARPVLNPDSGYDGLGIENFPEKDITSTEETLSIERDRYNSNPLNTIPFNQYWEEKQRLEKEQQSKPNRLNLSGTIINCDCISFMNDPANSNRFDHIITDPPYAINMDMLTQDNVGMTKDGIDFIRGAHDVTENIELLQLFWSAAYKCTRENAFVITFCDPTMFSAMLTWAEASSFVVQRWPIIWRKINQSSQNSAAGYNTTKDYEIILIARKKGSVLFEKRSTSFIDGSNNEAKKITGHPFAKPFEVIRNLCSMIAPEGSLILEPFAGGGSIVLEMLKIKMRVVALEKDQKGYEKLLENIKREHYLKLNPTLQFT